MSIRLSGIVNDKHELIVTLPDDIPVGPVELVLQPIPETVHERETILAQLKAADILVKPEDLHIPSDLEYVSDEELLEIGVLPEGAPRTDQLIAEDRGSR